MGEDPQGQILIDTVVCEKGDELLQSSRRRPGSSPISISLSESVVAIVCSFLYSREYPCWFHHKPRVQGDRKGRSLGDCVAPTIQRIGLRSRSIVGAGLAPALEISPRFAVEPSLLKDLTFINVCRSLSSLSSA